MKNDAPPAGTGGWRDSEIQPHRRKSVVVTLQPESEVLKAPVLGPAPDDLAESEHAGKEHILDLSRVGHPFRPHVCLSPEDVFPLFGGEIGGCRRFWIRSLYLGQNSLFPP